MLPGTRIAESAAVIAAVLLTLLTVRFILHPATLSRDLANPVVGGVAPTFAMGWMLVSLSVWEVSHPGWALLWLCALGVHMVLLSVFCPASVGRVHARAHGAHWFVPPVGIIVAAVSFSGPHEGPLFILAVVALYPGIIAYAAMLPVMFYRFIFAENVPVTAMPTLPREVVERNFRSSSRPHALTCDCSRHSGCSQTERWSDYRIVNRSRRHLKRLRLEAKASRQPGRYRGRSRLQGFGFGRACRRLISNELQLFFVVLLSVVGTSTASAEQLAPGQSKAPSSSAV